MVLIPVVNLTVHTPALRQERTGLGNLDLTLFATSDPLPNFHLAYGIDIFFNTGKYDRARSPTQVLASALMNWSSQLPIQNRMVRSWI